MRCSSHPFFLMLTSSLILLLMSNAVNTRRETSILYSRIGISSLSLVIFLACNNLYMKPLESGLGIFGGLFNVSLLTYIFNIFILLITVIILGLTGFYPRKIDIKQHSSMYKLFFYKLIYNKETISNKKGEQFRIIEYTLIIIFILCGAIFLMSTADLVSLFLTIELQSYGLYILCTLYRNSESATSSGLTYFLLGGMSSCFILLGSALLYANSGTTSLENIYSIISIDNNNEYSTMYLYQSYYFHLSLIIMCVGLLFKVSASPFHFWSPDVYDGIPTIVTTFVAIIAKISIFIFLLELIYYTECYYFSFNWQSIFLLSSFFSLIIGSVLGLTQFRIKRLFAYSTISHVGFILLALSINSSESVQSYIFYILQYSISNLNAFIILITIGYTLYIYVYKEEDKSNLIDVNNSPIQLINQIKGYFYVNPYIAISLAITLFSFVGIPPIVGFFAKQMILSAALDKGYIFMAFVAILTSVIGAGYYLNLIKHIFFFKNDYEKNTNITNLELKTYLSKYKLLNTLNNKQTILFNTNNITVNSFISNNISILTLLLILFIYTPDIWLNIVNIITLMVFRV